MQVPLKHVKQHHHHYLLHTAAQQTSFDVEKRPIGTSVFSCSYLWSLLLSIPNLCLNMSLLFTVVFNLTARVQDITRELSSSLVHMASLCRSCFSKIYPIKIEKYAVTYLKTDEIQRAVIEFTTAWFAFCHENF